MDNFTKRFQLSAHRMGIIKRPEYIALKLESVQPYLTQSLLFLFTLQLVRCMNWFLMFFTAWSYFTVANLQIKQKNDLVNKEGRTTTCINENQTFQTSDSTKYPNIHDLERLNNTKMNLLNNYNTLLTESTKTKSNKKKSAFIHH